MGNTMSSIVRFEGLMVFHPGDKTWDVGVLTATDEVLKNIGSDLPGHVLGVKDHRTGRSLISGKQFDQDWYLDVIDQAGNPKIKIAGNSGLPKNRRDANGDLLDIGWLINLKKEFHPNEDLKMKPGMLSPIIHLSNGRLYTSCKTDGIAYWRDSDPFDDSFGFIAETIALGIETDEDELIVLKTGGYADLKMKYRPEGYQIDIENVPPGSIHAMGDKGQMDQTEHFQLYYQLLFPDVRDKCHLELLQPPEQSPNLCAMADNHSGGMKTIPPYVCGGIICDETGCWSP